MRSFGISLFIIGFLLLSAGKAQTVTGTILGTVTDSTGARVPGATVRAIDTLTGEARSTNANHDGDYMFPALPVGQYRIETEAGGFKKFVRQGIALNVNQNARVDARLEVGQVTEEILVTGEAPQVDTRQVQVGSLVDSRRVTDLPLNGRNVYSLVSMLPGVSGASLSSQPDTGLGSRINVNGSRSLQSTFLLDGGLNNGVWRSGGLVSPNPDAVEEFRLITSNYNAEYGRSSGGVINVVTKSGGNGFHGSLYDYLRNDALDARSFFQPSVTKLRQNQFGGSLGGPIRHDKLFFFGSYQGERTRSSQFANNARTPTTAQRSGDFSALPANQRPKDPDTGAPFPNGIIPALRMDPVALNLLKIVPLPNTPDGRVEALRPLTEDYDHYLAKSDYLISSAHRLSLSYFFVRADNFFPFSNANRATNIPDYDPVRIPAHQTNITANETWTVGPSLLNQFTGSFLRVPSNREHKNRLSWPDWGSKLALGSLPSVVPQITVTGAWQGGSDGEKDELDQVLQLSDSVTWIRGSHSVKTGGSFVYLYYDFNGTSRSAGLVGIGSSFTGNAMADFQLGRAASFDLSNGFTPHLRSRNWAGYLQDDWKISRRFTLNLGLRYELFTPYVDTNDRLQQFRPGQQSTVFRNAPVGLVFPGDAGVPPGLVPTDRNNFAPRLGLAIDPFGDGKTSIRAGYGVFYSVGFAGLANSNVGQPFQIDVTAFGTPSFVDPFANAGGNPFPIPAGSSRFVLPVTAAQMSPETRNAYVQQYSLTIQRQLARAVSLDVAYVGNTSRKLQLQRDLNQAVFTPGKSTTANVNDRRPMLPGTYALISGAETGASANYNSLQVTLNRRFANGFTLLANYTFSKTIDLQSSDQLGVQNLFFVDSNNLRLDRGLSDIDLRHAFNLSFVWNLPQVDRWGFVGRRILSGWQANGIGRIRGGSGFSVVSGVDSNLNGVNNDRPDLVGDPILDTGRSKPEKLARYFEPTAFRSAALGSNGTAGRNILLGPGSVNWDLSLFRDFALTERYRLQYRAEFFNALNHANFSNPNANLSNANVGRILGANSGRIIQFGLRLTL